MANRTKLTTLRRAKFLKVLAASGNVTCAAVAIGMRREYLYEVRARNKAFAKLWDKAVELGVKAMEDEATRRAVEGWDEPVFYQGVQMAVQRKYSDNLLMFRLKAQLPEKYRDRTSTELTGPGGGPVATVTIATDDPIEAGRQYLKLISGQ